MSRRIWIVGLLLSVMAGSLRAEDEKNWRTLFDGKTLDQDVWHHIGGGRMGLEDGALRTEGTASGLGVLLYTKERFGDCQIRVVFRSEESSDNAGVHVRIEPNLQKLKAPSNPQKEQGAWWAVHHGYEVQICDAGSPISRTGSIYSLAPSSELSQKRPDEWKTMIITLDGDKIQVAIDGQTVTEFDPQSPEIPERKEWYEPRREPKRPQRGLIGLQFHAPGDVVFFKEVSVRPLPGKASDDS